MSAFDWDDLTYFFGDDAWTETATYGGTDYDCIRAAKSVMLQTRANGELQEIDFVIYVQISDFAISPATYDSITFDGSNYQIMKVETDSTSKVYKLYLANPYQ